MKRLGIFLMAAAILSLSSSFNPVSAKARKQDRAQLDSLAGVLAGRLEKEALVFFPDRFTGSNNECFEFIDSKVNRIVISDNAIFINLDFVGARLVPMASTPHQKGRALLNAAEAVHRNGILPNYVRAEGTITQREVRISKNSKNVSLEIRYNVEKTNLNEPFTSASITVNISTTTLRSGLVFHNMDLDGTMDGKLAFVADAVR